MRDPRLNVSRGLSVARLKLQTRRATRPLGVVIVGLAVAAAIMLYIGLQTSRTLFDDTGELRFQVADATGIVANSDDLRVSGVPAGRLTKVDRTEDGRIIVTAQVKKDFGPFYRNARAELRPVTPLQDMYLDIVDRGTPDAGKLDGSQPLPASQTQIPVSVADVLNVFRPTTRAHLASLLNNLGRGLQDHGDDLRRAFVVAAPLLKSAEDLATAFATREHTVKELVHNTSSLTAELSRRNVQLRTLIRDGSTAAAAVADQSGPLDQTLRELPLALSQINGTFRNVSAVLPDVDLAVDRLGPVARDLPRSLAAVRRLTRSANPALATLRAPVGKLVPLAKTLPPLARSLQTTVSALRPQVPVFDRATVDAAKCKKGIAGFFIWNTSIGKFSDVRGPTLRGNLAAGANVTSVAGSPFDFAPTACVGGTIVGGRPPEDKDMK